MTTDGRSRTPQAFTTDDPNLRVTEDPAPDAATTPPGAAPIPAPATRIGRADLERGFRWGALLLAAAGALASLAVALTFARFVAIAYERHDWIGWVAFALLVTVAVAGLMLTGRELVGFFRQRRLGRLRADAERALLTGDAKLEHATVRAIVAPLSHRAELKWALARLSEHGKGVADPGDLLRLADRDVMAVLDGEARRVVAGAARRIATVTAISPTALLTVGWVLIENMRLLRALAGLYGGRPGFIGTARLARMVFTHIVATGGVAMTEDLVGQFLGQDLLRRLSRRLGEGVFNAALTARIGAAAIEVIRPLPFIEAPRIRARDFLGEITRRSRGEEAGPPGDGASKG